MSSSVLLKLGSLSVFPCATDDEMEHGVKFNDALLELPIFKCKRCKHFLKAPIIFVPNIGNVCESCLIPTESFVVRNTELEQLMGNFVLPCRFNKNGCGIKLNYSNIILHQTECYYRDQCCPLRNFQNCAWKGPVENLREHVAIHSSFVQTVEDNTFKISIYPDLEIEILNFIVMKKNNFIFHAKCNEDRTKLHYKMYYLPMDSNSFLYVVKQKQAQCVTGNSEFVRNSRKIENVYDEQFFDEFDYNKTFYVDLQIFSKEEIEVSIVVTAENSIENLMPEAALKALECGVCKNYMVAQIFQCELGHSICSNCKPGMKDVCPTCRCTFEDTRNYSLEMLSENLHFPCLHQEQGCRAYNLPSNHELHSKQCFYKLKICPFSEIVNACAWEGLGSSLIKHLQDEHSQQIFVSSFEIISQEFLNSNLVFCMIAFDNVFKVTSKPDTQNWIFNLVSQSEVKFAFSVGKIYDKNVDASGVKLSSSKPQYYCRVYCQKLTT